MNSKEIMVNLMAKKICEYIDAGDINKIVVHGKEFAEVKKGKWIDREVVPVDEMAFEEWQQAQCSECKRWHTTPYMYYFNNYNYCPYCGADMRKETNK